MIDAFRRWGHTVEEVALVPATLGQRPPEQSAMVPRWKSVLRSLPGMADCFYPLASLPNLWLLARASRHQAYDFIYERYAFGNFAGVLWARWRRVPLVLEVNSPLALELSLEGEIRAKKIARWSERTICNLATLVVVVSDVLRRMLIAEGVRASKILVLPNGVNLQAIRQARLYGAKLRPEADWNKGDRVAIGFVGWFRPWHGLENLLTCFRDSPLLRERAVCVLVGGGPTIGHLQHLRSMWNLTDCVHFAGPLAHELALAHASRFDVFVQPAANAYCCPMKLVEALALGKAVVAPDQPNIRELVDPGREALLFRPGDTAQLQSALERLVECEPLRRDLGEAARRSILTRRLLWLSHAQTVVELVRAHSGAHR